MRPTVMTTLDRWLAVLIALLALVGDALLLHLQVEHDQRGVLRGILTDTIFFSDLSNLLVAIVFTLVALNAFGRSRPWWIGLALCCILLTFLGSNGWLGFVRPISGNTLVHTWVPLLTALWCIAFTTKGRLAWRYVLTWAVAGLSYLPYVFVRGALTGRYPYPFLNPHRVGWTSVLQTSLIQTATFVIIAALIVFADKLWAKRLLHRR